MGTEALKKDFPIFKVKINNHPLIYLDNAATTQKPKKVLQAISNFYSYSNANVHRGVHTLSEEASEMYDEARRKIARFINASHESEVIFTSGATDSLNFVASTWARNNLKPGDVILVTDAEHHSNLVPWQIVAQQTGAELDFVEVGETQEITLNNFKNKISEKVKLAAFFHCSNVLGAMLPVREISKLVKNNGGIVVVDGAQAVPHVPVNVQNLDCDFYAFSGHKMLGPMGTGVLWMKRDLLDKVEPYRYGGGMIDLVEMKHSTWADPPEKFEAGTPNVAGIFGLGAAVDYLTEIGMENIMKHEREVINYAASELSKFERVKILGPKDVNERYGMITFYTEGAHAHDVATVLNSYGVAVRSGHHCTMPLHKKYDIPASLRASFYIYNNKDDVDVLTGALKKAFEILG
ncbi:cysteine desulfurase [candidate division WWE3 bacterium]|jgi:cysteine desulfurase/selenocysteine lyase|uniref:Cysteine desulfurase n=1 Tax=candidate division WWE3 bacterium TaxID=2053526 RepID=A0A3A4ZKM7_UNCKA|nr:MAG: cysteine desulfurase [candidate division WWE3 bacterium]